MICWFFVKYKWFNEKKYAVKSFYMFTGVQSTTKINRLKCIELIDRIDRVFQLHIQLTINFYVFKSTMIKIHDRNKK